MRHLRRSIMVLMVVIILIAGTGISAQPAQASSCSSYHVVRHGETLSWIGRYYGVNWVYLAQINHIAPPRYVIYTGQWLCIAGWDHGGVYPYPPAPVVKAWSYSVVKVEKDTSLRIRTSNFPSNVLFDVSIGRLKNGAYEWIKVADLDSDSGGAFGKTYGIPAEFAGIAKLAIRITQAKKNTKVVHWFNNIEYIYYSSCGCYYPTCCGY